MKKLSEIEKGTTKSQMFVYISDAPTSMCFESKFDHNVARDA